MAKRFLSAGPDLPKLPGRRDDSHKGDFGRALLIGGSRGMAGAIGLAGMSALRSGAGLVRLAIPDDIVSSVAAYEPSYMTSPLACDSDGRIAVAAKDTISELANWATCIACGPGLGRSQKLVELVEWMYAVLPHPMVFDADALHALAQHKDQLADPGGPRILTPHSGEFRRFITKSPANRTEEETLAVELAAKYRLVIVLKGHGSLITDGTRSVTNTTGNPGMATGGTGDVLTGVITALVCQGLSPFDAARLGAHVHGLAGDLAAQEYGFVSMIASDLIDMLPAAFRKLG